MGTKFKPVVVDLTAVRIGLIVVVFDLSGNGRTRHGDSVRMVSEFPEDSKQLTVGKSVAADRLAHDETLTYQRLRRSLSLCLVHVQQIHLPILAPMLGQI